MSRRHRTKGSRRGSEPNFTTIHRGGSPQLPRRRPLPSAGTPRSRLSSSPGVTRVHNAINRVSSTIRWPKGKSTPCLTAPGRCKLCFTLREPVRPVLELSDNIQTKLQQYSSDETGEVVILKRDYIELSGTFLTMIPSPEFGVGALFAASMASSDGGFILTDPKPQIIATSSRP